MHVQTHFSRPTPNETSHQLPSISQQNGIPLLSQVQPDELRKSSSVYSDLSDDRKFVQERIIQHFLQRQIPSEMQRKLPEITRQFDEHLFNEACSREEYINMDTLERRLHICIQLTKRLGQQRKLSGLVNSVSSVGTMVPTPDFYQTSGRNSLRLSQGDNFVNASNMVLLTSGSKVVHGGSFNVSGCVTSGTRQSPVNISTGSCRNYVMPAKSIQNIGNQMIPTRGLSDKRSMHTITKVFSGDEYLIYGEPRNLSFLPSSIRSTMCKQNPGNLVVAEKPNSRNNSHLLSSLAVSQPAQMKSLLYNESRKVNIESACSHSEHDMRLGISHHEQLQLPNAQFIGNQDSLAVENEQLLAKYDRVKNSHLVIEAGNQNLVDHRVDLLAVRSHAPISEQSQLTGSKVDFREQNNLGEDYKYKGDQAHKSVGSCDVHPSLQSDPLSQEQGKATISSNKKFEDDFYQRITDLDAALQPLISVKELAADNSTVFNCGTVSEGSTTGGFVNVKQEQGYKKHQRWLLFLRHARTCSALNGKCRDSNCFKAQELWQHMFQCKVKTCSYPSCLNSKALVEHHIHCKAGNCPVCIPVRRFLALQHKAQIRTKAVNGNPLKNSLDSNCITLGSVNVPRISSKNGEQITEILEEQKISVKRMKMEHSSTDIVVKLEGSLENSACIKQYNTQEVTPNVQRPPAMKPDVKEAVKVKAEETSSNSHPVTFILPRVMVENLENIHDQKPAMTSSMKEKHSVNGKTEIVVNEEQENRNKVMLEKKIATELASPVTGTKSTKLKIKGVSLIELFTPEQVREHINSLRQWVGQSKPKAEKSHASGLLFSENSCQLCGVEKLSFDPPLIYCSKCASRIKRSAMYYTTGIGDSRHFFCTQCFSEARGELVEIDGNPVPKSGLEKKENDEETEEGWVQCDKCEGWQHQVCALFNIRRNEGQAEYTCPPCYISAIESGERKPLPQSTVLGAKDLPRTVLSDHIEQRLAKKLKQERQDRAKLAGKNFDEVPGAEALVVRVVLSVDKRLEVKQQFLENFLMENYPTEFTYKSKVILLFQKIEGVEVCLFGMYVQEFGSECPFPNQRRVYLSYLDSVKYFRPQIKAVSGEALRTFVYHEILIGYLEYCKIRGFTSCYIWACPPLIGEDYILYCHPEIQKTPKSDKLREWYLSMLRKASHENIAVEVTNFYDHFFTSAGECKTKVTASRLPYFEGDYWPGAAEDLITQLHQDEGRKQQKKEKLKKFSTKRALKTAGSFDPSCNVSKEVLIMQRIGEIICPMKEDFIMVHLQYACSYCCHHIVFGKRWVCRNCRSFRLCDKCYDDEQKLDERERHPANSRDKHLLLPVEINVVPADTNDRDEILDCEFFDTRQAFLSLCQGNHYQYDTLRRAKHSSMMVLYHLHNPTAPAFATTCNICLLDIDTGQGWRCEVCPDFDVCNTCYRKDNKFRHPHTLTHHPSMADHDAQNQEARQQRVWQLQRMLGLLGHACQCRSAQCKYPKCRKVKTLFRHGIQCTIRASGGCSLCGKMWYLLRLHARACKQSECLVPRCKDLKEHMKRLQQQADSRRRAAVMEMMRQRAGERKVG